MGRRFLSRASNGRFRRATLANTFGLHVIWCADCRGGNTYGVGEERPASCRHCNASPLRDLTEVPTDPPPPEET